MSEQNPYEQLGVTKDATFDEIQDARNHLLQQYDGDLKRSETVEAAYDAILMERLRMRQDGKIKVPEGIRFAERLSQASPKETLSPPKQSPAWLERLIDTPSLKDVLLPGFLFLGLSSLSIFYRAAGDQILQLALIIGGGISIYFLNRKEKKFGRAALLTICGLIIGLITGGLLGSLLQAQLNIVGLGTEQFSTVLTFFLFWLFSSFLR